MFEKLLQLPRDRFWFLLWIVGILFLIGWDAIFLNTPAFERVLEAAANTVTIASTVIILCLGLGWITAVCTYFLQIRGPAILFLTLTFLLNIIRSIPQIVGILMGYVLITSLVITGTIASYVTTLLLMSLTISLFVFLELTDLIIERIQHFRNTDFYNAMKVCGISELRIVNYEILFKNAASHIFNKLISIFGITIFLQCSIDFIISVGLTQDVSGTNLPLTLGSLLARIDSKQDILAIGHTLTNPSYAPNLFLEHLQGITVAFLIVFSLVCIYRISHAFAHRNRL